MPIITSNGPIKKIMADGKNIRAVFVGSQRVWPSGEAFFSWPHNSGLLASSSDSSLANTNMARVQESITVCEMYQPANHPGLSADAVLPWWSSGYESADGGLSFVLPASQGGKYRVQGTVDLWLDSTAASDKMEVGVALTYSAAGFYTLYKSTQISMPVRDRWHRVAYDLTIANTYGARAQFYPFAIVCTGSTASQYPFAFSNVNVGITRVYT